MRRVFLVTGFLLGLVACGDNIKPAADDAGVQTLAPCLEGPDQLPLAPTGQLPCDLLPPDFVAAP